MPLPWLCALRVSLYRRPKFLIICLWAFQGRLSLHFRIIALRWAIAKWLFSDLEAKVIVIRFIHALWGSQHSLNCFKSQDQIGLLTELIYRNISCQTCFIFQDIFLLLLLFFVCVISCGFSATQFQLCSFSVYWYQSSSWYSNSMLVIKDLTLSFCIGNFVYLVFPVFMCRSCVTAVNIMHKLIIKHYSKTMDKW